jgi:NDP-sugar pyrophosphorylase family protein
MKNQIQVVILAGGLGTRLGDMTKTLPKPMIEVEGKPFLEILLEYLKSQGFKRFLIILGYLPEYIPAYFGDGSKFGLEISYSGDEENLKLGTGGALKRAESKLDDEFMLLFGDTLLPIDYADFWDKFKEDGGVGSIVAYDNNEDTDVLNNLNLADDGKVLAYVKNSQKQMAYVDSGALCFKREVLDLIEVGVEVSLEEGIYPKLLERAELYGYITDKKFYDIGTPGRLEAFKLYLDDNR